MNEGKLPLGNTQNTYLPFDVRRNFGLNTFLENDSIYAYHFYRLLQNSKNIYLLYNALGSGVNTGEKSRFITQMEMESPHKIEHIVIENTSEPILQEPIIIEKTEKVLEKLNEWKGRISASHLISYLYNPIDFYLNNILKARETEEIEEELSQRNYGNLVHYALDELYEGKKGKIEFVLIAMQDEEQKVRDFIKKNGYTTPVYLLKEPLSEKFSIDVFPTTFILGKDGQILRKDEGAADWNSQAVHSFIEKL